MLGEAPEVRTDIYPSDAEFASQNPPSWAWGMHRAIRYLLARERAKDRWFKITAGGVWALVLIFIAAWITR